MSERHPFNFPYKPYDIQIDFMNALYRTLSESRIGIFESPTGTGKSLSLICGSLTWLRDEMEAKKERMETLRSKLCNEEVTSEVTERGRDPEWITNYGNVLETKKELNQLIDYEEKVNDFKKRLTEDKEDIYESKRLKVDNDDVKENCTKRTRPTQSVNILKIIYCSRTHSQLGQFINEVNKTDFSSDIRVCVLGSRTNLCINREVNKTDKVGINDKCLDLLDTSKGCHCKHSIDRLSDTILDRPMDIEELVKVGNKLSICPYYSSREAANWAQLIVLPYQSVFHKATRESLNIDLDGNVVIVDEAHNLLDTVAALHSPSLTPKQVASATNQVKLYLDKYRSRTASRNLYHLKQMLFVLERISAYLDKPVTSETIIKSNEFLFATRLDNINMFDLLGYCRDSRLSRKLRGFGTDPSGTGSGFYAVEAFLQSLTSPDTDGRVTMGTDATLRYIVLNPCKYLEDVLTRCRSVVLAGGTMRPADDIAFYANRLRGGETLEFSCGHVIPETHVLPLVLSIGPSGSRNFRFVHDSPLQLLDELARSLLNLFRIVPAGVVVFLPSYAALERARSRWADTGALGRLDALKPAHWEPRTVGVDSTLVAYSASLSDRGGAALFSVVGGKMSEGINFSDDLCRCVVMVGLPYPNAASAALQEKIKYMNEAGLVDGGSQSVSGDLYYHNLCMKAVNQCIGRSIRHRSDYSCIILVDERFNQPKVTNSLPQWIRSRLQTTNSFAETFRAARCFFNRHKAGSS